MLGYGICPGIWYGLIYSMTFYDIQYGMGYGSAYIGRFDYRNKSTVLYTDIYIDKK